MPKNVFKVRATISVVINTLNAERLLDKCLESVRRADEIIVCDMHSDDSTVEIAKKFGCKIFYHERIGYVEPARNYALSRATSDWVLVLDADEVIPEKLWNYLVKFTQDVPDEISVLEIPRETFALGQSMRCLYQSKLKRFWRNGACKYSDHVHEIPKNVFGKTTNIKPGIRDLAIEHYHVDSLHSFIERMNRYTDLEIQRFEAKGEKFNSFKLFTRPFFEFFKSYILKGGILDGKCGLIMCVLNANYKFSRIAKLYEKEFKTSNQDLMY